MWIRRVSGVSASSGMRRRNIKRRRLKRQEMRGGKEEETRSDCGKAPEEQRSVTPLVIDRRLMKSLQTADENMDLEGKVT
jgi:hypothetical protein